MGNRHNIKVKRPVRDQVKFFHCSLDDLVGEEHKVREVWNFVEQLDVEYLNEQFCSHKGHKGRPITDRRILLALWIYGISEGSISGRRIAHLCKQDMAYCWLAGGVYINYHTLDDFASGEFKRFHSLLVNCLALLMEQDLIDVKRIAVDGTKIRANAGVGSFRNRSKLEEMIISAEEHIRELNKMSSEKELTNREQAARERHAREKKARREQALHKLDELEQDKNATNSEVQASTTDSEAKPMRHGSGGGIHPSYNAQIATDTDSGFIVATELTEEANDAHGLTHIMDDIENSIGKKPNAVVADGDYMNYTHLEYMAEKSIPFYAPKPNRGRKANSFFHHNSRLKKNYMQCPNNQPLPYSIRKSKNPGSVTVQTKLSQKICNGCPYYSYCHPKNFRRTIQLEIPSKKHAYLLKKHKKRMKSKKAQTLLSKRFQTERANAILKNIFNLKQFNVTGKKRSQNRLLLSVLAHNFLQARRSNLF